MIYAVIIALILIPPTKMVEVPDTEIVRRGNFVIAATVDGFLCYGTKVPRSVSCHRAVQVTQFGESVMLLGRSYQAEDLPKEADLSVTDVTSHYTHPPSSGQGMKSPYFANNRCKPAFRNPHYSHQSRLLGRN